jgi:hypothetical protein
MYNAGAASVAPWREGPTRHAGCIPLHEFYDYQDLIEYCEAKSIERRIDMVRDNPIALTVTDGKVVHNAAYRRYRRHEEKVRALKEKVRALNIIMAPRLDPAYLELAADMKRMLHDAVKPPSQVPQFADNAGRKTPCGCAKTEPRIDNSNRLYRTRIEAPGLPPLDLPPHPVDLTKWASKGRSAPSRTVTMGGDTRSKRPRYLMSCPGCGIELELTEKLHEQSAAH